MLRAGQLLNTANALRLLHPLTADWVPEVLTCSSLEGGGVPEIWTRIGDFREIVEESGALERKRADQARRWMWGEVDENLLSAFRRHPNVREKLSELEEKVSQARVNALGGSPNASGCFSRDRITSTQA